MHAALERDEYIERLYHEHYRNLEKYCIRKTGFNSLFYDLVDECIQDVFIQAYTDFELLKTHPNVGGWLKKACHNRLIPYMILIKNQQRHFAFSLNDESSMVIPDEKEEYRSLFSREEAQMKIDLIVKQLTPAERLVYEAYFINDLSEVEVAKRIKKSPSAIKSTIHRIREKVKKIDFKDFFVLIATFSILTYYTK